MAKKTKNIRSEDAEIVEVQEKPNDEINDPKKTDVNNTVQKSVKSPFLKKIVFLIFLSINSIILLGIVFFILHKEALFNAKVEELKKNVAAMSDQLSNEKIEEKFGLQISTLEKRIEKNRDSLIADLQMQVSQNSNRDDSFLTEIEINRLILKEVQSLENTLREKISSFRDRSVQKTEVISGLSDKNDSGNLSGVLLFQNKAEIDLIKKEISDIKIRIQEYEKILGKFKERFTQKDRATVKQSLISQRSENIALLRRQFVVLARKALQKEILSEGENSLAHRIYHYIRSKFVLRFTSPHEGNSTNAILSRIENHLRSGDLKGALEEVEKLDGESEIIFKAWKNSLSSLAFSSQ